MLKKVLSIVLVLTILIMPLSVSAAVAPEVSGNTLSATVALEKNDSVYAVISIDPIQKVQGLSFRLTGLSRIVSRTVEWCSDFSGGNYGNTSFTQYYDTVTPTAGYSYGTVSDIFNSDECYGSVLFGSGGYSFTQKTDIVRIKLGTSGSYAAESRTVKLVIDEFYGYSGSSDMQNLSTSVFNLRIEKAVKPQSISVTKMPTKTTYYVGESSVLNTDGIVVTATNTDKTTTDVTDKVSYSSFSTSSVGTKTITVTLNTDTSITTTFTVTVENAPLTGIAITTQPTKTEYVVGDTTLNKSGLVVTGTYANGSSKNITSYVEFSGFNTSSAGTKKITVYHKDYPSITTSFNITVVANELVKLEIKTKPTKLNYYIGQAFDSTGIKVMGTYKNNSSADITSKVKYQGFDSSSAGTKTVYVISTENTNIKSSFDVVVSAVELKSITLKAPTNLKYFVGDTTLDTAGMVVTGTYTDGSTADITSKVNITGFDTSTAGSKVITVAAKEKPTLTKTFSISVTAVTLNKIELKSLPTKLDYIVGDTALDPTGIKVLGTYNNGTTADLTNKVTYSGFSATSAGTKTITVTAAEKTSVRTTFTIVVASATLKSIAVTTMPSKVNYTVGETSLVTTGIVVTGTYSNGTTANVTSKVSYSGFSATTAGEKTITVTSTENTSIKTTFKINVSSASLKKIDITTKPTKLKYYIGQSFDPTGIVVKGTYTDNTTQDLSKKVTYSGFDSSTEGTKKITVTATENTSVTTTFDVTVAKATLKSIAVTSMPTKTKYYVGDASLDTTGIVITGTYEDGKTSNITSNVTYSGFTTATVGNKTIKVVANEKTTVTTSFTISVEKSALTKITIEKTPDKKTYYVNEKPLDTTGIKIIGTYANNSTADVTSNVTYSGFDTSSTGEKTITVTSKENTTIKTTFKINVSSLELMSMSITQVPTKTSYYVGDETLDTTGIVVTGTYNNGSQKQITSEVTYSGFDTSSAGKKTITVTSTEKKTITATFQITVVAVELVSVTITQMPNKTNYFVGDTSLDKTGIVITGTYNNKSKKDITSNVVYSGFNTKKAGTVTITVNPIEKVTLSTTFNITVLDVVLSSIIIEKNPTKMSYYTGDSQLDTSGIKVTGTYNNNKVEDVTNKVSYSGFTTTSAGTKKITVTSTEFPTIKTSFNITVTAVELVSMTIKTNPTKTTYYVGDTKLDTTGIEIIGSYNNGTTGDISNNVSYSTLDTSTVGKKTITVTAKAKTSLTATFTIEVTSVVLTSIEIVTMPTKTVYYVGESQLNTSGIVINGTYNNGKTARVTNNVTYTGFTTSSPGVKTITVISTENAQVRTSFNITVSSVDIVSIAVSTMPKKTTYYVGDTKFDPTGIKITATLSNNTTEDVTDRVRYEDFDTSSAGKKAITVVCIDKPSVTKSFNITVVDVGVLSISVPTKPIKTTYYVGDEIFEPDGISVFADYNNGTTEDVTNEVTYSGFTAASAGTKRITVTYKNKSTTFNITVLAVTVTGINIISPPAKTDYFVGDEFDKTGISVTAAYNNGTTQDVTDKVKYSGFTSSTAGAKKVTVTYESKTASFNVNVSAIKPKAITLVTPPSKTNYYVGDTPISTDGMKITATYNNGETKDVTSNVKLSGFDTSKAGEKTITATLNTDSSLSVSFKITVEEIKLMGIYLQSLPEKTQYFAGSSLETRGISVYATYSNGSSENVTSKVTYSGYDMAKPGKQNVIVEYGGFTAEFEINVADASVKSISLNDSRVKKNYFVGDELDTSGLVVTATYDNGKTQDVTDSVSFSGFSSAKPGTYTIKVTYGYSSATYNVTVKEPALTGIELLFDNVKTVYYVNDEFSAEGVTVMAKYENNSSVDVTAESDFSGFDSKKAGSQRITVSYLGKTAFYDVKVTSITLTQIQVTPPEKTEYFKGDDLDTSGMKVVAYYSNGDSADVTNQAVISGFDSTKSGKQLLTVSYGGKSELFEITINDIQLQKIEMTPPTKRDYYIGDSLSTDGMKVTAYYSDDTTADVTLTAKISGFDSFKSGKQIITVSYGEKSAEFEVELHDVTLESIVITPPVKTEYYVGESLDTTGLIVTANYSNGTSAVVTNQSKTAGADISKAGEQEVTVIYGTKTASFKINVIDLGVSSITVTPPNKKDYYIGEDLNVDGIVVTAYYSNGTSKNVTQDAVIGDFDSSSAGQKIVEVTYEGQKDTFTVTVSDIKLTEIKITPPDKTEYFVGEAFSADGMTAVVYYSNGVSEIVTDQVRILGFNSSTAGKCVVTISYGDQYERFEVTIHERKMIDLVVIPPSKTEYSIGDVFSFEGMSVTAVYNNETSALVTNQAEITGFDSSTLGKKTITVSYGGMSSEFDISVSEAKIIGITVTPPIKTEYYPNDEIDLDGMIVTANYSNGFSENVSEKVSVSGFDSSKPGLVMVMVKYKEFTGSFDVTIVNTDIERITLTPPTKTEYFVGDTLSTAGMTVTAYYTNGTSAVVNENLYISGFDSTSSGRKVVRVVYEGRSATFNVTVSDIRLESISLVPPDKRQYHFGDKFSSEGMVVTANYSNGTSVTVTDQVDIRGFDSTGEGKQIIKVYYGGKSAEFDIEIIKVNIVGISFIPPLKTEYFIGDVLNKDGMVVTAEYSNHTSVVVTDYAEVSGFSSREAGLVPVTVSFGGYDAEFDVTINEAKLVEIEILPPEKIEYAQGDTVDYSKVVIIAHYSSGETADVTDLSQITYSEEDDAIKAIYGEATSEYSIKRLETSLVGINLDLPKKLSYLTGEGFDKTGLRVIAEYSDGSHADVTDKASITGFDSTSTGTKTIEVTYSGFTKTFDINVSYSEMITLVSLSVTPPEKLDYFVGDNFDKTGMKVIAVYSNGVEEDVTSYCDITGFNSETAGSREIVVSYGGESYSFNIYVDDAEQTLKGDVNHDGVVNSEDALMVLRASVGFNVDGDLSVKTADMDGDNDVNSADALLILRLGVFG